MANCNKLFLDFNKDLTPGQKKKDQISTSRENVRKKIRKHFKENHPEYEPFFKIQGSSHQLVNTIILYKDDTCDLDDGVYFFREPNVTAKTLQGWIKDAVKDVTSTSPEHRRRCIRVKYEGDYHIDLPVYYKLKKDNDSEHPELADKEDGFSPSDPKEFAEWFHEQKDEDRQLVRIVKYLKAWGDNIRNKMPSGLAMTLLACECVQINNRDDISLRDTLIKIKEKLDDSWVLKMPTCPGDDLFDSFDDEKKNFIIDQLKSFIEDASSAIDKPYELEASKLWAKHLGKRFPEGKDEDTSKKEKVLKEKAAILGGTTPYVNRQGRVTDDSNNGKKIPDTKNYGG
ncbi:MAG TPA: hypothetical protein DD671_14130, partial [Balneolaceae bacterium]|nr:hypothetical protein [Balneolaceae bacterium]